MEEYEDLDGEEETESGEEENAENEETNEEDDVENFRDNEEQNEDRSTTTEKTEKNQENGFNAIHRLMALALLPPEKAQSAFNFVKSCCASENKKLLEPLFSYFKNQWLEKVGAKNFSVYKKIEKTNNAVEAYHADWRRHVRAKPASSTFIGMRKYLMFQYLFFIFKSYLNMKILFYY